MGSLIKFYFIVILFLKIPKEKKFALLLNIPLPIFLRRVKLVFMEVIKKKKRENSALQCYSLLRGSYKIER